MTHPCMFSRLSDDISVSNCKYLSLSEYAENLPRYCSLVHKPACSVCPTLLSISQTILTNGFVLLSQAFKSGFPHITYHSHSAKRRLLQLPLVSIRVGQPKSGVSELYLFEYIPNVNYRQFLHLLNAFHQEKVTKRLTMTKEQLHSVLSISQSDRERECIRYTALVASGLSATSARRVFGFERVPERVRRIEDAIAEAEAIRSAYESIAKIQEKATLAQFGISYDEHSDSSSNASDDDSAEDDTEAPEYPCQHSVEPLTREDMISVLAAGDYNWFELVNRAEELGHNLDGVESEYESLKCQLGEHEVQKLEQSHSAFLRIEKDQTPLQERETSALNGEVVSESDSDHPDDYMHHDRMPNALRKKVAAIRLKCRRNRSTAIAKRNFLQRKQSKKVSRILSDFPEIGKEIEDFVSERSVGADAWRRTGVLTFDGNKPIKQKVTYSRIKEHLQKLHNRNFSYGTVVQLCVARNQRRRSALRYKGLAKVTSRRARKGFQLRFNPDNHWSSALYRNLSYLQYTDGTDILNINRDDAAGFRLDTLATHRLHRTPVVEGREILTTHTDYVNSYPSVLQTSSYNFTATRTTAELCAGVVKGAGVFLKNAGQHAADLSMLESVSTLQAAFLNPSTTSPKQIECIRVDGATDEGPSHQEIQFWWALRHLKRPTVVTLVTARNSGASYLNRVELQNGCLALAHANLFIPSTLSGSCFSPETGRVDPERLKRNMDLATEVYISRVNGAPCGDASIQLFKGADSTARQELRGDVLIYLKGTKAQKTRLQRDKQEWWSLINEVWDLRNRHAVPNLPPQYIFFLKCCQSVDCNHPFCKQGTNVQLPNWFPGGPSIEYLPMPVPDPGAPWGNTSCPKCQNRVCYGHFLTPDALERSTASPMHQPPSHVLKEKFSELKDKELSDADIEQMARATLLSPGDVRMWLQHLQSIRTNRRRGVEKAAATRRSRKTQPKAYVCLCGEEYTERTDEIQYWIGCDKCNNWFHYDCVGIDPNSIPERFICTECC